MQCVFSDDCSSGLLCSSGLCRAVCNVDSDCIGASAGFRCSASSVTGQRACLPPAAPVRACQYRSDCAVGETCSPAGACVPECSRDSDCTPLFGAGATCAAATRTCSIGDAGIDASSPDAAEASVDAAPDVPANPDLAMGTFDSRGGTLQLPDVRLLIPRGALTASATITLRRTGGRAGDAGVDAGGDAGASPDAAALGPALTDAFSFDAGGTLPLAPGAQLGVEFDLGDASMPRPTAWNLRWVDARGERWLGGLVERVGTRWVLRGLVDGFSTGQVREQPLMPPPTIMRAAATGCLTAFVMADGAAYTAGRTSCFNPDPPPPRPNIVTIAGGIVELAGAGPYLFLRRADDEVLVYRSPSPEWPFEAPLVLPALHGWRQLSGGGINVNGNRPFADTPGILCGRTPNDTFQCVGTDAFSALTGVLPPSMATGDTFSFTPRALPSSVPAAGLSAVASNGQSTCAWGSGQAKCWGTSGNSQLGPAATGAFTAPVTLSLRRATDSGDLPVELLALGAENTCAVLTASTGRVVGCVGNNVLGGLGTGGTGSLAQIPAFVRDVTVTTGDLTPPAASPGFPTLAAGAGHYCAVHRTSPTSPTTVICWGRFTDGQVDAFKGFAGPTVPNNLDMERHAGETFLSVHLGDVHSCVLTSEGRLICWGSNLYGQTLGAGVLGTFDVHTSIPNHDNPNPSSP